METFRMDDRRSTRHLSQNKKGEENSARSYRAFMLAQLRKHNGVMISEELEEAVFRNYGDTFGPDDLRLVKKRPKWKNTLDWAKAVGARKGEVATRSCQENKKKVTYIVLLDDEITDTDWIRWAKGKTTKKSFKKRCKKCLKYSSLSVKVCRFCGTEFPPRNRRVDRLPKE